MKSIYIFGTGGCGREVLQLIEDINRSSPRYQILGFIDDNPGVHGQKIAGLPVLGNCEFIEHQASPIAPGTVPCIAMGVGSPLVKSKIFSRLSGKVQFERLIHPTAIIGKNVDIGEGVVVGAGCIITVDVRLETLTALNIGVSISHDVRVASFCLLNPGVRLAGAVKVGQCSYIGMGAHVLEGRSIGEWTTIGGGALVNRDIPNYATAVGVPARIIKLASHEQPEVAQVIGD